MDWLQIAQNSQENFIFPKVMAGIVFVFLFFFIKDYVIKAFTLNKKLSTLISKFKNKEIDRNKLDSEFNDPSYLENAWLSYKKTFHHIK